MNATATATTEGIPTLRSALRRARRLGAEVTNVHATGEVRVVYGETRLTINARRKDATRELAQLLTRMETDHPTLDQARLQYRERSSMNAEANAADHPEAQPIEPVMTFADRLRNHLRTIPADDEGWRPYDSTSIADDLGVTSTGVAAAINHDERQGRIERKRNETGSRIVAIRFTDKAHPVTVRQVSTPVVTVNGGEPVSPRPVPLGPTPTPLGMIPVPHLSEYAEAVKLSKANPLLQVNLDGSNLHEVLHEAVRLYWWVLAGKR